MRTSIATAVCAAAFAAGSASQVLAQPVGLDKLVSAYPSFLVRHDGNDLVWKDGTKMAVSDGQPNKTFAQRLLSASIADQLSLPYRKGPLAEPPGPGEDPGRFRNAAFFDKMYGDCTRNQVQPTLVMKWVPKLGGQELRVTSVNGGRATLAESLRRARTHAAIPTLSGPERRHLQLPAGAGYRTTQHARMARQST